MLGQVISCTWKGNCSLLTEDGDSMATLGRNIRADRMKSIATVKVQHAATIHW